MIVKVALVQAVPEIGMEPGSPFIFGGEQIRDLVFRLQPTRTEGCLQSEIRNANKGKWLLHVAEIRLGQLICCGPGGKHNLVAFVLFEEPRRVRMELNEIAIG